MNNNTLQVVRSSYRDLMDMPTPRQMQEGKGGPAPDDAHRRPHPTLPGRTASGRIAPIDRAAALCPVCQGSGRV